MPAKRPTKKTKRRAKPAKRLSAGSGGPQSGLITRDVPGSNLGPATKPTKRPRKTLRPGGLNEQQRRFVAEYLIDLNGKQAAIRAGYAPKTAESQASRLLSHVKVAEEIRNAAAKREERTVITADVVLSEFLRIARVDISGAFDERGDLKPIHEIPEDVRRAMSGVEVEALFEGRGEDREQTGYLKKVKFWDKNRALEALAKHLGLLIDRSEVEFKTPPSLTLVLQQGAETKKP